MSFQKLAVSAVACATAVVGLNLVVAGPAAAATGVWRAYTSNPVGSGTSSWHCGAYRTVVANVSARVCGIKTADGTAVQTAVVVNNDRANLYSVAAAADLTTPDAGFVDRWSCASSGVAFYAVCFGATRKQLLYPVEVRGGANGVNLPMVTF
jgi:hypothetical protein